MFEEDNLYIENSLVLGLKILAVLIGFLLLILIYKASYGSLQNAYISFTAQSIIEKVETCAYNAVNENIDLQSKIERLPIITDTGKTIVDFQEYVSAILAPYADEATVSLSDIIVSPGGYVEVDSGEGSLTAATSGGTIDTGLAGMWPSITFTVNITPKGLLVSQKTMSVRITVESKHESIK